MPDGELGQNKGKCFAESLVKSRLDCSIETWTAAFRKTEITLEQTP